MTTPNLDLLDLFDVDATHDDMRIEQHESELCVCGHPRRAHYVYGEGFMNKPRCSLCDAEIGPSAYIDRANVHDFQPVAPEEATS